MIWLRHPRPEIAPGTCYGRLDVPARPRAAAEIAGAVKAMPRIARVVASPAARCRLLAERVAEASAASLTFDDRLWELDFGAWEGMPWDAIPRAELDPWANDPWSTPPPGGERFGDLHARIADVIADFRASPSSAVAVISHAGPIRAARMIVEGADFDRVFAASVAYARPIWIPAEAAEDAEATGAADVAAHPAGETPQWP